jgi:hypothetical protein
MFVANLFVFALKILKNMEKIMKPHSNEAPAKVFVELNNMIS